jgi:hypothetical protein
MLWVRDSKCQETGFLRGWPPCLGGLPWAVERVHQGTFRLAPVPPGYRENVS